MFIRILKYVKPCFFRRTYTKAIKKTQEMKYLNVAEKHDAAKTIAGLLSNGTARRREGYSVYNKIFDFEAIVKGRKCKMVMTSVSGHLLQLEFLVSYRNWRNVNPQSLFDAPIKKMCNEDFQPIKRTLEREIRNCQGLIIWTDCDREGENIGYEIIDVCRAVKPNIEVHRAMFSEITGRAVKRALEQLKTPDKRQSDAVDVRSELDLRTGAAITRFQTLRLQRLFPQNIADKLISYGSCQIPTLGFVAERYKEIEAFVSEPFWKIKVTHTIDDLTVDFNWARNRLFDKQACEDYFLLCLADPLAKVEIVTVKPKSKWRPTPMDTVEMEKLGSRKLKLSAKETMTIAEKLYTKGIISYPRTETNQFSKEIDLSGLVEQQIGHSIWGSFAQRVKEWGPNPRNGNKSDQAHPPIHPTKLVTDLNGNEARVYELVCRHFLACVSKDAVGSETLVHINIAGEKFTGTGLCIYERNYLDVYIYDKWNAKQIHKYDEGQTFEPTEISMPEGATTAPALLTEADLIALMEKHGIGTDATHAEHINTIKERGYIGVVDKGGLVPGVIGMGLYEGYDAMELALAKPVLRAEFEADLKRICLGEKDPKFVLREQIQKYKEAYKQIMDKITALDEKFALRINEQPAANVNANERNGANNFNTENNPYRIQELFKCPKCDVASLALKQKKNQTGHFIGCLNFPDCKNVIWLPDDCKEPSVQDENCSKCGDTVKILKFKFQNTYHKMLFNTPTGWYKTCLRCDSTLRETFNINLESVKRAGAIISDQPESRRGTTGQNFASIFNIGNRNTENTDGNSRTNNTNAGGSSGGTTANKTNKSNPKQKKTNNTKTKKKTITNTAENSTNIRTLFTTATSNREDVTEDAALNDFFDDNDGFDDILLAAEANIVSTSITPTITTPAITTTAAITNRHPNMRSDNDFCDDIAAAFANSNDDDFDNLSWGTNARNNISNTRILNSSHDAEETITTHRTNPLLENSFYSLFRNEPENDDYAWGTAARKSQSSTDTLPAAKRTRSEIAEPDVFTAWDDDGDNYTWGSAAAPPPSPATTNKVKCTGCHQIAKELTVKKDGPNKGRQFFACPKPNGCNFFQWADEITTETESKAQPSNTSSRSTTQYSGNWQPLSTTQNNEGPVNPESNVNCNCGTSAKGLIVRKDGPNKGRPFYACSKRDKSCGFFQWADVDDDNRASTSAAARASNNNKGAWGINNKSANAGTKTAPASGQNNDQRDKKARKCGLCRKEGHTKQKCPRKAEFEF